MQTNEFKKAVGKFPTGVTIITTTQDGQLWGFTANSFVSVSLEPSLISFCLNKEAGSLAAFKMSEKFAINILAEGQADLARRFASKAQDKFSAVEYEMGEVAGAPLISGAVSYIECRKYNQIECGDHYMFIGEVLKTEVDESKSPMLYFAREFRKV